MGIAMSIAMSGFRDAVSALESGSSRINRVAMIQMQNRAAAKGQEAMTAAIGLYVYARASTYPRTGDLLHGVRRKANKIWVDETLESVRPSGVWFYPYLVEKGTKHFPGRKYWSKGKVECRAILRKEGVITRGLIIQDLVYKK